MPTLDLNPQTVCRLMERAREFHAQEQVVIPNEPTGPSDSDALQVLADHADDPTYQELKAAIEHLEPDQQVTLVALMWLGRGDFDADDWDSALAQARESRTPRTADYLIATPLVADYLDEGLAQLGYSCDQQYVEKRHPGPFSTRFGAAHVRASLRKSNTCAFDFRCGTSLWRLAVCFSTNC